MAYPLSGVTYKHTPKFVNRMKDDEGVVNTPFKQTEEDPGEPLVSSAMQAALKKIGAIKED